MSNSPEFINALAAALKQLGTVRAVGDQWVSVHGIIPNGGVPFLGQEVSRNTYSALWQWAQDNDLVISESEWQSLNTSQNGNVPKYSSGDGSTTFRMPKVTGYIKCSETIGGTGTYTKEGLPNIVGTSSGNQDSKSYLDGAFALKGTGYMNSGSNAFAMLESFDASRCSPIYGNSAHVTPETMTVLFGVYAFGEVTNVGAIDLQALAQQLNTLPITYLKTVGGELNGSVNLADGVVFYGAGGASNGFHAYAGKNNFDGATLQFFGSQHPTYPGHFYVRCSNRVDGVSGTGNSHTLKGDPASGVCSWDGTFKASVVQSTSDIRLKSDISPYTTDLSALKSYKYVLNADKKKHIGLIAQEVKEIIPEAVSEDENGFYSLDYNAIVAVLVGKVNELESRLKKLEG